MKVRIALAALAGAATLATAGVALTASSAGASTIPVTVSHVISVPPGCATRQLSATLTSGPQTRGNYRELILTLTNTSHRACTLSGYPGLQLLNRWYQPLPTTTVRIPGRTFWPAQAVVLPSRSVTADIMFSVLGYHPGWKYPVPPVFPQNAAYLAITLPGAYQAYGQQSVLKIPGGPVWIVQDKLSETPLMGHFPIVW